MQTGFDLILKCGLGLLLALVLAVVPACQIGGSPDATPADHLASRPIMPGDFRANGDKDKRYMLIVQLQLISIEVPVGQASNSEEIWSYLDEEAVEKVRTPSLGFNGMRVGVGKESSWPDLVAIFETMTGRKLKEATVAAIPGRIVPITVKSKQPTQTIFFYEENRTLRGEDYPPGDNILAVSCTLDENDPSRVMLTAVPQVRTTRRSVRFVDRSDSMLMLHRPTLFSLSALTFQVTIDSKDFLVIGPGSESARASSFGHHFFVKQKKGMEFETILILRPQVVATPIYTDTTMSVGK